ncbi:MAG: HAMP domain-containing protein, partial [Bacteroidetes bacterium]|nr:HAMP domain-containing protein [Bacteroidota bacterium]
PVIKNARLQSNSEFADLSEEERKKMIKNLNNRWQEATDVNDPFIQPYITNPAAEHLKKQQEIFAGRYGEIFLTNVYGAMISTTGKLTTLAHAHKYWWKACYQDGQGRIFLDDRGFDTSVKGYVLGVVIPVRADNEIIGILKCNVNLLGPLTDVVQGFSFRSLARIRIVRTGGLIVSEKGVQPLSTKLSEETRYHLQSKTSGTSIIKEKDKQLVAFSPIIETLGSEKYGFGGSYESIDHIKGNQGDAWHIVISLPENIALEASQKTTRLIFIFGVLLILLVACIALILGRFAAAPIVGIAKIAQEIGHGALDAKANISSNDEIGSLAIEINRMAERLQETITSKDKEITLR